MLISNNNHLIAFYANQKYQARIFIKQNSKYQIKN